MAKLFSLSPSRQKFPHRSSTVRHRQRSSDHHQ
ncbi:hypothetical protein COLO4_03777 [Corchorus olitorius]|uniref:Uncharacterized protein n=1 Tax=Corchorus olitorius TaxID=93759 RepID=A0A1R3KWU9_9ROSI|nr:hypothetical protein COLO4_32103 [Corchorus olitorius]OMP11518.1 hypothetical protein COLO4_03777 [Corchorus olitorius]